MKQHRLELADVFRTHQHDFLARWNSVLSRQQRKAVRDIRDCRTAVLGGHLYECDRCGHRVKVFNSCRNRNCPKCQATARAKWLAERQAELLPVPYFHVLFTLPQQIGRLALQNPRSIYNILLQAASETLLTIADCFLSMMPLFHLQGLLSSLTQILAGGTVVITPGFDANAFLSWVEQYHPTWYTAGPTLHQAILPLIESRPDVLERFPLRFVRSIGAPLPQALLQQLERSLHAPALEGYGMTEAGAITSNALPPPNPETRIGRPEHWLRNWNYGRERRTAAEGLRGRDRGSWRGCDSVLSE